MLTRRELLSSFINALINLKSPAYSFSVTIIRNSYSFSIARQRNQRMCDRQTFLSFR